MNLTFTPGTLVRLVERPDWGTGQVQSAVGERITVNFPDQGKVVLDARRVTLVVERSAEAVAEAQDGQA